MIGILQNRYLIKSVYKEIAINAFIKKFFPFIVEFFQRLSRRTNSKRLEIIIQVFVFVSRFTQEFVSWKYVSTMLQEIRPFDEARKTGSEYYYHQMFSSMMPALNRLQLAVCELLQGFTRVQTPKP